MPTKKRKVIRKFIDPVCSSFIQGVTSTGYSSMNEGRYWVGLEIQMKDCDRQIEWHDFGRTRKEMNKKLDVIIDTFTKIKGEANKMWDVREEIEAKAKGDSK